MDWVFVVLKQKLKLCVCLAVSRTFTNVNELWVVKKNSIRLQKIARSTGLADLE